MNDDLRVTNIVPAKHVTVEEADACADFAAEVAYYLHLPRYQIVIESEPCHEDALASIHLVRDRHFAQIALSAEWMERPELERMQTMVHEVLHIIHRGVDHVVDHTITLMHDHEFEAMRDEYQHQVELMVDYLSMFVGDFARIREAWVASRRKFGLSSAFDA